MTKKTVKENVYDLILDLSNRDFNIHQISEILRLPEDIINCLLKTKDSKGFRHKKKANIPKFSHIQREILVGTILGDCHISRRSKFKSNWNIFFHQKDKLYMDHLYTQFYDYFNYPPKLALHNYKGKNGEKNQLEIHKLLNISNFWTYSWQLRTFSLSDEISNNIFSSFMIEKNKKWVKTVPLNIDEFITPRSLAYWIADDGFALTFVDKSNYENRRLYLCTESFTLSEVELLCKALYKKLNLITTPHLRFKDKDHYRIYFSTSSLNDVYDVVFPYLSKIPSKLYKLPKTFKR